MHTSLTIDTAWGIAKNFFKNSTNAQKRKAEGALEVTDQAPTKTPRNETNPDTDTQRAAVEFLQPSLSISQPPPSQQVHLKPARVTPSNFKLISRADGTPKIVPPVPQTSAVHVLNCVTIPSTSRWLQRDEETHEYSPDDFLTNINSIEDINVLD